MTVWRLASNRYASSAFTGIGAATNPGRWNMPGHAVVYTSEHLSLASLEVLANADLAMLKNFSTISCILPDLLVETLDVAALPPDWRTLVHPQWTALQRIGSDWLLSGRSLALRVPSAVIDGEFNILLNPGHSQFASLRPSSPVPFVPDPRFTTSKTQAS
ncbi:MAG: RES family NAD+ phosphorylase [Spirochaetales bacterium]